jgi:hypothetical protein
VRGDVYWALYRSGDVGLFGPGNHKPVYSGHLRNVDLNDPESSRNVTLRDVAPHKYKPLAYVDVKESHSGTADPGDPVTLPHGAVVVGAGEHAHAPVVFDFVR